MRTDILAVTLARGGSKGVPHKHTRLLGGKPVLAYTIEAVQASVYITDYVVSSDDDKILEIARRYNVATIKRPAALAQDTTPTLPALRHAVECFEEKYHGHYEYIVEVRATSPFKTTDDIDDMIELLTTSGADSVIGVTELDDHHPARAKWIDNGRIRDFIPEPASGRRQDMQPKAYIRNGTVYAFRRDALMGKDGKLFGHEFSLAYVMPAVRSVNIDRGMDWLLCEALVKGHD